MDDELRKWTSHPLCRVGSWLVVITGLLMDVHCWLWMKYCWCWIENAKDSIVRSDFTWMSDYTKYDIQCHTVFNVTMVSFQMTPLMNKGTNIVMDDGCVHPMVQTLPSLVNNL